MKSSLFIIFTLVLLLMSSCSQRIRSIVMVGRDYELVRNQFSQKNGNSENIFFEMVETSDSLFVISKSIDSPLESLFVFSNDTCRFQVINIYCSPCADKYINGIMDDKFYNFEAKDKVNYVSKSKNVVLRLTEALNEKGNCNKITVHSLSAPVREGK